VRLARIIDPTTLEILSLAHESDASRLETGASVKFIADDYLMNPRKATIKHVGILALSKIEEPVFASTFGGRVAVRESPDGENIPDNAVFKVHANIELTKEDVMNGLNGSSRAVTGIAFIKAKPESYATLIWRRIKGVLIREVDF